MSPSTMSSSIASLEDEKRNDSSRISNPTASSAGRRSSDPLNPSHTGHAGEEAPRWIYRHSGKKRARTLVLCFDGTGDQFDDDVRGCFDERDVYFLSISLQEFQYCQVHVMPQEGRPTAADGLLPGEKARCYTVVLCFNFYQ